MAIGKHLVENHWNVGSNFKPWEGWMLENMVWCVEGHGTWKEMLFKDLSWGLDTKKWSGAALQIYPVILSPLFTNPVSRTSTMVALGTSIRG